MQTKKKKDFARMKNIEDKREIAPIAPLPPPPPPTHTHTQCFQKLSFS